MADEQVSETFDASNPAAEDNARRDAARLLRQDADVLRSIMHSKEGRSWLYRKLASCHIFENPFYPGQSDVTFHALGEQNVGKKLMAETMAASADLYMKMIKEQQDEEKRLNDVRRTERKNREKDEQPISAADLVAPLPPPAGYPGGPPLPKKPNKK